MTSPEAISLLQKGHMEPAKQASAADLKFPTATCSKLGWELSNRKRHWNQECWCPFARRQRTRREDPWIAGRHLRRRHAARVAGRKARLLPELVILTNQGATLVCASLRRRSRRRAAQGDSDPGRRAPRSSAGSIRRRRRPAHRQSGAV